MSGRACTRIEEVFVRSRSRGRAALMPYLPLGFPTLDLSLDLVEAAVANGADMIELGVTRSRTVLSYNTLPRWRSNVA